MTRTIQELSQKYQPTDYVPIYSFLLKSPKQSLPALFHFPVTINLTKANQNKNEQYIQIFFPCYLLYFIVYSMQVPLHQWQLPCLPKVHICRSLHQSPSGPWSTLLKLTTSKKKKKKKPGPKSHISYIVELGSEHRSDIILPRWVMSDSVNQGFPPREISQTQNLRILLIMEKEQISGLKRTALGEEF